MLKLFKTKFDVLKDFGNYWVKSTKILGYKTSDCQCAQSPSTLHFLLFFDIEAFSWQGISGDLCSVEHTTCIVM